MPFPEQRNDQNRKSRALLKLVLEETALDCIDDRSNLTMKKSIILGQPSGTCHKYDMRVNSVSLLQIPLPLSLGRTIPSRKVLRFRVPNRMP